jgi:hypothetical protein
LEVKFNPIAVRDVGENGQGVATFARSTNGGLIVTAGSFVVPHRDLIGEKPAGSGTNQVRAGYLGSGKTTRRALNSLAAGSTWAS